MKCVFLGMKFIRKYSMTTFGKHTKEGVNGTYETNHGKSIITESDQYLNGLGRGLGRGQPC